MDHQYDHISVCICTYKRQSMLENLLMQLENQETCRLFTYSIVVVDNDSSLSAKAIVDDFKTRSRIDIDYHCEPTQNISLARNKCIQKSKGSFVALIDDDEFPDSKWLLNLYQTCNKYNADGALGPVKPCFEENPPKWVVKGKFYEKGRHKTGAVLNWQDTRTSNVLMKKDIFTDRENMFSPDFSRGGEDMDFFMRMIGKGYVFVWCNEASISETIPPERCRRFFMLKRALLRGKVSLQYSCFSLEYIIKSIIAVPTYMLVLPLTLMTGHHHSMIILIRLFEHLGRLLALCGIDVIKQHYVME